MKFSLNIVWWFSWAQLCKAGGNTAYIDDVDGYVIIRDNTIEFAIVHFTALKLKLWQANFYVHMLVKGNFRFFRFNQYD
ncbi:MAG: hypothetical protein CMM76_06880 [Rhodospirillaceae bacterium]|nr:hypothetical protein [Rhodospirillaceae bacterium]